MSGFAIHPSPLIVSLRCQHCLPRGSLAVHNSCCTPSASRSTYSNIKALTSAQQHLCRTDLLAFSLPPSIHSTPNHPIASSGRLFRYAQRHQSVSGFVITSKTRHAMKPKRIRFTADCIFASSCSPPHLTMTQFLSATGSIAYPDMDLHHADCSTLRAYEVRLQSRFFFYSIQTSTAKAAPPVERDAISHGVSSAR